jgi:2-polyprenyl-3-methyl-5-hydroxy-6-metoxy-1,4-benzoquinol methylase
MEQGQHMDDFEKQDKLKEFYDSGDYYSSRKENFADRASRFNRNMVKNVLAIYCASKKEKALDVGCGWGNISLALQKRGVDVTGLDYSEESVRICRESAKNLGLNPEKFVCRDAANTGFEPSSFDAIYCADLVEHVFPEVYLSMIQEFHRILKRGGKLVIYTPDPHHIFEIMRKHNIILKKDEGHVDFKTRPAIELSLRNNGFSISRAYFVESHVPIMNILERALKQFVPFLRRRVAVLAIKD